MQSYGAGAGFGGRQRDGQTSHAAESWRGQWVRVLMASAHRHDLESAATVRWERSMSQDESSAVVRLSGVDPLTFFSRLIDAFAHRRYVSCDRRLRLEGHGDQWIEPRGHAVAADAMIIRLDGSDGEVITWIASHARAALVDQTSYHEGAGATSTSRWVCVDGEVVFSRHETDLDRDPDHDAPVPDARDAPLPAELLIRLGASAAALFTCDDLDGLDPWDPLRAWAAAHPEPEAPPPDSDEIPF